MERVESEKEKVAGVIRHNKCHWTGLVGNPNSANRCLVFTEQTSNAQRHWDGVAVVWPEGRYKHCIFEHLALWLKSYMETGFHTEMSGCSAVFWKNTELNIRQDTTGKYIVFVMHWSIWRFLFSLFSPSCTEPEIHTSVELYMQQTCPFYSYNLSPDLFKNVMPKNMVNISSCWPYCMIYRVIKTGLKTHSNVNKQQF